MLIQQLSKKRFSLMRYNQSLREGDTPVIFFLSRFGKVGYYRVSGGVTLKSLKASLIRKVVTNDIFSGTGYLLYGAVAQSEDPFLESFKTFQTFSTENSGFLLQNVAVGRYLLNYNLFNQLTGGFELIGVLLEPALFQVSLTAPFFARFLIQFLRVLFVPHFNILNALVFKKRSICASR